ncbi:hypothetical protein KFE25_008434 [Diacronema lutheri]|uniref:G protein-coupled receptor n=1 Tax=Diacronema lutheri TaxID=2081491 RepID=A0A8J5X8V8_DIALT|nr:hypothetical protein KFE25_008434 [Diacronema lutheri]
MRAFKLLIAVAVLHLGCAEAQALDESVADAFAMFDARISTDAGVAISVAVGFTVAVALMQSSFAAARVTQARKIGSAGMSVKFGAASLAHMMLEQCRFLHSVSFAVALPKWYATLLSTFKWANFVIVTKPFAMIDGSCRPPGSDLSSIWRQSLDLMKLSSPEAFFVCVTANVAGVLFASLVLNLLVWLYFARRLHRPLPALWSPPSLQARVLLAAYPTVTQVGVLILASDGCSRGYTAAAGAVVACVPCALIAWVLVALRDVVSRTDGNGVPLLAWVVPSENDGLAGAWRLCDGHGRAEGERLVVRMGILFTSRTRATILHLPINMALVVARVSILVCSAAYNLIVTGGLLVALDLCNVLGLLAFRPFNARKANVISAVTALARAILVAMLFLARGADTDDFAR